MKILELMRGKARTQADADAEPVHGRPLDGVFGFAPEGVRRLAQARALVIGVGGIGCAAAPYLAAAGLARLQLCDFGRVASADLSHAVLFGERDVGRRTAEVAANRLQEQHRGTRIHALAARATEAFFEDRLPDVDIVIDASNDEATGAAINAACLAQPTPWVSGRAIGGIGELLVLRPDVTGSACERCATALRCTAPGKGHYPGAIAGIVGAAMALQALRILAGQATVPMLHRIDATTLAWHAAPVTRDPACAACSGA